jgi:hypothetical protein
MTAKAETAIALNDGVRMAFPSCECLVHSGVTVATRGSRGMCASVADSAFPALVSKMTQHYAMWNFSVLSLKRTT